MLFGSVAQIKRGNFTVLINGPHDFTEYNTPKHLGQMFVNIAASDR